MFFYLALSVICTSFLFVTFKFFERFEINNFQGIVFNYWAAAMISFFISFQRNMDHIYELKQVWPASCIIGFMFITVFYITALTTQKLGMAVASVAAKMSVVIPIAAGVLLYSERLSWTKIIGILIALTAIYFTSNRFPARDKKEREWNIFFLPVILFIGTGMVDASIKFAQHTFMNDKNRGLVIMSLFAAAGTFGIIKLAVNKITKKEALQLKSILGGICLGTFNYFSLFFLLKCLETPGEQSSIVFALLNIGIVLLTSIISWLFFKEKISANNFIGITLAILAIIMLTF